MAEDAHGIIYSETYVCLTSSLLYYVDARFSLRTRDFLYNL